MRCKEGSLGGALDSLQECEQLQKMYGGHMDERTLEKTQQQHMLYQQEQHHQILHQQIQVLEAIAVCCALHAAAARARGSRRVAGVLGSLQREASLKDVSSGVCRAAAGPDPWVSLDMSCFANQRFLKFPAETLLIANTCYFLVPGSGLYPAAPAFSTLASSL